MAEDRGPAENAGRPEQGSGQPGGQDYGVLQARIADLEGRLRTAEEATASVVGRYREARLASAPEIPAELVAGNTVEEIDAALTRAQSIVDGIRQRLAPTGGAAAAVGSTAPPAPAVPAGSPPRSTSTAGGWGMLTPAQRIRNGLTERS